ncbi:MAG TPA: rhodanese-like domain-containing protein, partial [Patescibacteria group bacterium]
MGKKINNDKSVFVVAVGFVLIAAVTGLILWKSGVKEKQSEVEKTKTAATIDVESEKGVESSELFKMILGNSKPILIDIRSPEEFNHEHIQDSKNILAATLAEALRSMDKGKTYVIVSGGLSTEDLTSLSNVFRENGIENYLYLRGGLPAWKKAYNPTVSEGDPTSFTDQAKVTYIKSDELNKLIASDPNLFIIDLRKSGQFKEGHIKNAVNIFLDNLENENKKILPGRKIILCDNDGLWAF